MEPRHLVDYKNGGAVSPLTAAACQPMRSGPPRRRARSDAPNHGGRLVAGDQDLAEGSLGWMNWERAGRAKRRRRFRADEKHPGCERFPGGRKRGRAALAPAVQDPLARWPMAPRTARSVLECASPLALWAGAPAKTATGPALGKVGRAVLCPPPLANRCVLVHHAGAHGVTRPTTVGGWWPATKTWPRAVWGGRTGQGVFDIYSLW